MLIYLPVARSLCRPLALARFCGAVSLLMKSGVSYHTAVAAAGALTGFNPYAKAARETARILEQGQSSGEAWAATPLFPPALRFILRSAEAAGGVPGAFGELAALYQAEAEGRSRIVAVLAPPACMILTGGIVSALLYGILAPLIKVLQAIGC